MPERNTLIDWLNERFTDQSESATGAKYERLYEVILYAIREGVLAPGDRLPPEQSLSTHLPLSQATVRKCFTLLAQRGVISREHGRGTFISDAEQGVSDLWHFRFRDPDGPGFMPIYNRVLSRTIRREPGVAGLFPDTSGEFVCIERAVNIGSRFNCYSEMFLPAETFARIMDEPAAELERVNLKDVLAREFRSPTLWVDQNVQLTSVPARACEPMSVTDGAPALLLNVIAYSFEDKPISFQRIWIPETPYELNMPASADTVAERRKRVPLKVVSNG